MEEEEAAGGGSGCGCRVVRRVRVLEGAVYYGGAIVWCEAAGDGT